jgi:acyl dehydratase
VKVFSSAEEFKAAVGQEVGVSEWLEIDQDRINTFAEATGDHQWIHVDPERAATGPYGTTIAHGYLTLSLLAMLMKSTYEVKGATMGVNYGLNKVRFPAPVPVGSKVRVRTRLLSVDEVAGGLQVVWNATIDLEGSDKPACVAEPVVRLAF